MYCPYCGKQISKQSTFCAYCGSQLGSKSISAPKNIEWEYKDFELTWKSGTTGWISTEHYTEPAAKLDYWQNYQSVIMPDLQKWLDKGWQPIGEIGASCIQLRYFHGSWSETQNWLVHIIMIFVSMGAWIFFILLGAIFGKGQQRVEMIGFKLKMRRPKS